ncbi:uncharacterized protein [Typha latifolia]|uniref:uncharacterized protein n=1 Tax=Typha latifolia TaxID=4733 RepID=UPI003C303C11
MSPDSNECSGGGESSEVEFKGREANVLNSDGDLREADGVAAKLGEEEEEEIGGSFVIVNGDSSDFSDKDIDLGGKVDPSMGGDEGDAPVLHASSVAGEEVDGDQESSEGEGVVVEVDQGLDNEHGHVEGVVPVANWQGETNAGLEEGEKDCELNAEKSELGEEKKEEEVNREVSLECSESYPEDDNGEASAVDGKADKGEELDSFVESGDDKQVDIGEAAGVEGLPEIAVQASDKMKVESIADDMQEPENLGKDKESGDQVEMRSVDEAQDKRGRETAIIEVDYQPGLESALMESDDRAEASATLVEEKNETCIASVEAEEHDQSEPADAHVEDKHDEDTLEAEIKDDLGLDSPAQVESGQESENEIAEIICQSQFQPTVEVERLQMPESLPVRQDELGSLNIVDRLDEYSGKNVTVPEDEIGAHLHAGHGDESPESCGASSICMADKAESSSDLLETGKEGKSADDVGCLHLETNGNGDPSETSENLDVSHDSQEELVKVVDCTVDAKQVEEIRNRSPEHDNCSSETEVEAPSFAVKESHLSNQFSEDAELRPVNESSNSFEDQTASIEVGDTISVCANEDTALEVKDSDSIVETNKDKAIYNVPIMDSRSHAGNDHIEIDKHTARTLGGVEASNKDDDKNIMNTEVKVADGVQTTPEEPSSLSLDGDKVDKQLLKRKFCYIIRVPKFTDDEIWAKIQHAQLEVDEKTKKRDSVHVAIQKQKVVSGGYRNNLDAARVDERAARARYNAKKQEISSIQSIIYKLNKVSSIEEIDEMIVLKERSLQHETMSLKQEKLWIQEIKDLKAERKKLSSNMGSKAEIDEAFDQRDQIYERLGTLRKELDILGGYLGEAEEKTKVAQKNYDDEQRVLNNLREQFDAANEVRQKAYVHWRDLKSETTKKNKYFFMYKDDKKAAANYLSSGDMEGLRLHCDSQVEKIMELLNKNQEFRQQYVESNKNSTLRRLGTLDGRLLGPDEKPPVLHSNIYKASSSPSHMSVVTLLSIAPEQKSEKSGPLTASTEKDSFPILSPEQTSQPSSTVKDPFPILPPAQTSHAAKSGKPKSASKERVTATLFDTEEVDYAEKEKTSKKEEGLAKNAEEMVREEELRMEKAAAEKERCRLEQKAKAKEAEDRKKRKAEKAKERAEYIAQKEAEIRDKRRAKKDKKKVADATDATNGNAKNQTAIVTDSNSSEITRETDVPVAAGSKRRSRSVVAVKQLNRIQPVPLPLRNRGKRKTHMWTWVLLSSLLVLVLFLVGNYMSSSSFSLSWFGV